MLRLLRCCVSPVVGLLQLDGREVVAMLRDAAVLESGAHSSVVISTSSNVFQTSRGWISSVLKNPVIVLVNASS